MILSSKPYTFDRIVRIVITIVFVVGALWLLKVLQDALLPFLVACLLAYLFKPFVAFNKKMLHCQNNIVPILLFLIEFIGAIILLGYIFFPVIINELVEAAQMLKEYSTMNENPYLPQEVHDFIKEYINFGFLSSLLSKEQWIELIKNAIAGTWTVVSGGISILMTVFSWFIVLLYFIFILMDYERFTKGIRNLVPEKYKKVVFGIASDIKTSMNQYFRGQALVAFIVGVLFSIGFSIIDMPLAIVFGLFIGLLNMVPYLQLISLVPAVLLCLVSAAETGGSFWNMFMLTMVVYGVVQVIQDMYLVPKIMGKTMGLNPAIILLSLSIWGTLLGFIGLIIALPLTTLLLSYYNRYVLDLPQPEQTKESTENNSK